MVHGAIRCQAAGMHLGARCTQASVHLLRDSLITHNTTSVPKRPDAPRCTVHLGARRPGCTLVQVHKRPDAPRCTVHLGARRPGCTSVQVPGDPNAPHQGAGAARAPCVTLHLTPRARAGNIDAVITVPLAKLSKNTNLVCQAIETARLEEHINRPNENDDIMVVRIKSIRPLAAALRAPLVGCVFTMSRTRRRTSRSGVSCSRRNA